jgi:hypothetical protein
VSNSKKLLKKRIIFASINLSIYKSKGDGEGAQREAMVMVAGGLLLWWNQRTLVCWCCTAGKRKCFQPFVSAQRNNLYFAAVRECEKKKAKLFVD